MRYVRQAKYIMGLTKDEYLLIPVSGYKTNRRRNKLRNLGRYLGNSSDRVKRVIRVGLADNQENGYAKVVIASVGENVTQQGYVTFTIRKGVRDAVVEVNYLSDSGKKYKAYLKGSPLKDMEISHNINAIYAVDTHKWIPVAV